MRARPQICSQVTGLRLCGIAELPRCSPPKGSSASRTSVRCKWRISSAIFSSVAAISASELTIVRVAIALNHLRSHRRDVQPKPLADALFNFRAEMRSIAHRAGNFADGHLRGGIAEALDVALIFREPVGDFQSERDRLGVNSVSAADLRSVREIPARAGQHFAKFHQRGFNQSRRVAHLQSLRGVDHIVGGHAVVQPARGGSGSPIDSPTAMVNAITSCFTRDSISLMRATSTLALRAHSSRRLLSARRRLRPAFPWRPAPLPATWRICWRRSRRAHFFAGIAWNQLWLLEDVRPNGPVTTGNA